MSVYYANVDSRISRGRPRKARHDQVNQIQVFSSLDSGRDRITEGKCMRRCMKVNEATSVFQD